MWSGATIYTCHGEYVRSSCRYGVGDLPTLFQPNRMSFYAHKIYIDAEPAAFFCAMREYAKRSASNESLTDVELATIDNLPSVRHMRTQSDNCDQLLSCNCWRDCAVFNCTVRR